MIQRLSDNSNILTTTGAIISYSSNAVPAGWLICDGSALNALVNPQYQRLYDAIGNTYGGSNNTNFQLPDLRGQFLRGLDHSPLQGSKGIDNGRTLGSIQAPQMSEHTHTILNTSYIGQESTPIFSAQHSHILTINSAVAPHTHSYSQSGRNPSTEGGSNNNNNDYTTPTAPSYASSIVGGTGSTNIYDYLRAPGATSTSTSHNHPLQPIISSSSSHSHDLVGDYAPTGGVFNNKENRPINCALLFLIKL